MLDQFTHQSLYIYFVKCVDFFIFIEWGSWAAHQESPLNKEPHGFIVTKDTFTFILLKYSLFDLYNRHANDNFQK